MSSVQSIIDWYYEQEFDSAWIEFDDFLVDAVRERHRKSRLEAELYATNVTDRAWNEFCRRMTQNAERGFYPTFSQIVPGVKRLFFNPNFYPHGISKADRHKRTRIRSRNSIRSAINSLSATEYEAACVLVCKLSGASYYSLTPTANEHGIDFFAVVPPVGRSRLFDGNTGPIRIVGQCKKHRIQVGRGVVQQLVTSLNSVGERSDYVRHLIPSWFLRERGPIVGWLVAHNGLQRGAVDYANGRGIIHSDSRDLAEIITMSRAWQPSDGVNAPVELMRKEIKEILFQ